LSSDPVEYVARPDPLARVRDGYGVIVVEDSMAPEFRSGDIALVNPHLPARAGDTCVFRHLEEDGTETAIIKHLRRATAERWLVTEWNSDDGERRDFELKRSEWQKCHVTVGKYSRR
jgi:phage repressor protein C with HTH and peptisase S24 domain